MNTRSLALITHDWRARLEGRAGAAWSMKFATEPAFATASSCVLSRGNERRVLNKACRFSGARSVQAACDAASDAWLKLFCRAAPGHSFGAVR
jgi:hypothetical protein